MTATQSEASTAGTLSTIELLESAGTVVYVIHHNDGLEVAPTTDRVSFHVPDGVAAKRYVMTLHEPGESTLVDEVASGLGEGTSNQVWNPGFETHRLGAPPPFWEATCGPASLAVVAPAIAGFASLELRDTSTTTSCAARTERITVRELEFLTAKAVVSVPAGAVAQFSLLFDSGVQTQTLAAETLTGPLTDLPVILTAKNQRGTACLIGGPCYPPKVRLVLASTVASVGATTWDSTSLQRCPVEPFICGHT